jgi:hypothetical protein
MPGLASHSVYDGWDWAEFPSAREAPPLFSLPYKRKPASVAMSFDTSLPTFRSSIDTDELRPALLAAGAQMVISLVGAVLLSTGTLA